MRALLSVLSIVLVSGCGSAPPLYSTTPNVTDVSVDGMPAEWPSALRPVPGESGLSVGLQLDGRDLVAVFVAGDDRQARRIALGGIRVWIDPSGGDDRSFAIRYPVPEAPGVQELIRSAPRGTRRGGTADPTQLRRRFEAGLDQAELTRGVVTQRVDPMGAGFQAAAVWGPQDLVVEMRIPLDEAPGLLETSAGGVVGIGVELLDVRLPQIAGRRIDPNRQPGGRQAERREPVFEPSTLTRWLRIERG
ncbi:MAG: hypothetical protein AAGK21_11605 [Bacteroidota bacterium]